MSHALRSLLRLIALPLAALLAGLAVTPAAHAGPDGTSVPTAVAGLSGVTQIDAGDRSACAVLADATVACWGSDPDRYGYPTKVSTAPQVVPGLTGVARVSTDRGTTCVARLDGTAWCLGIGWLGDGDTGDGLPNVHYDDVTTPVQVLGLTGVVDVSVGSGGTNCALKGDGTVWCWGDGRFGAIGDHPGPVYKYMTNTPKQVFGISTAKSITAGKQHVCAVLASDELRCWGTGPGIVQGGPSAVPGLPPVIAASATEAATCAVDVSRAVWCFGDNTYGEMGVTPNGPRAVTAPIAALTNAASVTTNEFHSCALRTDGTAACWGVTGHGELGNPDAGGDGTAELPIPVLGLPAATQISAGLTFTCALLADTTVRCWGDDRLGQLGNGDAPLADDPPPPAKAAPLSTPASVPAPAPAKPKTASTKPRTVAIKPLVLNRRTLVMTAFSMKRRAGQRCPGSVTITVRRRGNFRTSYSRKFPLTIANGGCTLTATLTLPKRLRGGRVVVVAKGKGLRTLARLVK